MECYGGFWRTNANNNCAERGHVTLGYSLIIADEVPGTDQSQGKGQLISNINACIAVQSTIKTTLGPYGGDLLLVDANGKQTITNDGATVMKVHLIPLHATGVFADSLTSCSISSILPREYLLTSRVHKMRKWATVQLQW